MTFDTPAPDREARMAPVKYMRLELSPDAHRRLKVRAVEAGIPLKRFVRSLVELAATGPATDDTPRTAAPRTEPAPTSQE